MAEVTGNLAGLPDADIAAIATYIQSRMGTPDPARAKKAEKLAALVPGHPVALAAAEAGVGSKVENPGGSYRGVSVYRAACAACHESGRALPFGGLPFPLSTAVSAPDPQNIINVVLFGIPPADGESSAVMPAFGSALSDPDLAALLNYLRSRFSDRPQWGGLSEQIAATRSGAHAVRIRPADGIERSPAHVGATDVGAAEKVE
jgi:mono/diheme cytochrome c family protein